MHSFAAKPRARPITASAAAGRGGGAQEPQSRE